MSQADIDVPDVGWVSDSVTQQIQEQSPNYSGGIEMSGYATLTQPTVLTQAILAKAFRGELTADWREQNPDLISGENSAEALLAKIKAERESIAITKKTGRKVKV